MSAGPDLGPPTTLLLVRHGLTDRTGRDATGGGDDTPLNDAGREQAELLAGADFDLPHVVLVSPTVRTRMTALELVRRFGVEAYDDPDWREVPSLDDDAMPTLLERVRRARDAVLAASNGATVVVVTHAGPIKALVATELGADLRGLWRLRIDPASITTLRYWSDGGCEVSAVNDTAHLR